MPNALKGKTFLKQNPEKRAEDLHTALIDKEVKAIINTIGGDQDAIEILPYINFALLKQHPKIFTGFSDTTTIHLMFYSVGVVSYYGPALLTDFGENCWDFQRLHSTNPPGSCDFLWKIWEFGVKMLEFGS